MKTAMQELIEWIEQNTQENGNTRLNNFDIIEKAKSLLGKQKKQIIDAYHINPAKSIYFNTGIKYYEETFKK